MFEINNEGIFEVLTVCFVLVLVLGFMVQMGITS